MVVAVVVVVVMVVVLAWTKTGGSSHQVLASRVHCTEAAVVKMPSGLEAFEPKLFHRCCVSMCFFSFCFSSVCWFFSSVGSRKDDFFFSFFYFFLLIEWNATTPRQLLAFNYPLYLHSPQAQQVALLSQLTPSGSGTRPPWASSTNTRECPAAFKYAYIICRIKIEYLR